MSDILIFILIFIITIGIILFFISKKFEEIKKSQNGSDGLQMLNHNIQSLSNTVANQIGETTRNLNDRLDNAARVMMAVNNELGHMHEIGSNLKNIQHFLQSPKLRGNLGEQGLKELLSQALPTKYFDIQYSFRSGVKVDAIIHMEAGNIPIDAKFPLENFNQMLKAETDNDKNTFRREFRRDFKKHIDAISSKYINPDEGTTDFAFMYIPSESIYFEVINNEQDLFEYAAHNHIVLSSPSTFFYYLRTIMLGLEGRRITEMSREILKTLKTIKQQNLMMGDNLSVLSKHVNNAGKSMSAVSDQYCRLSEKINKIDILEESQNKLLEEKDEV